MSNLPVKSVSAKCLAIYLGYVVLLFAHCTNASALNPNLETSQLGHTSWRMSDGSIPGAPAVITQTSDGYIWIGTQAGILRFDGVRFLPWSPPGDRKMPSVRITSLFGSSDGTLWIGTQAGLSSWKHGIFFNYPKPYGNVDVMFEDVSRTMWIGFEQLKDVTTPLCSIADGRMQCYGQSQGIPFANVEGVGGDHAGALWVGGDNLILRWRPGTTQQFKIDGTNSHEAIAPIRSMLVSQDGSVLVGLLPSTKGRRLRQLRHEAWRTLLAAGLDDRKLDITTLYEDRQGVLWIGTAEQGLYRVHDGKADQFAGRDGLSSDHVRSFYEDSEGDLWVATAKGVDMFRDLRVASFSKREGLRQETVNSVVASRTGTVWLGNDNVLEFLRGNTLGAVPSPRRSSGAPIASMLEDTAGRLWVGIGHDLWVMEDSRFFQIQSHDVNPIGVVVGLAEDTDGNIWAEAIGEKRRLLRIKDKSIQEDLSAPVMPPAYALASDPRGGIWLGLTSGDLGRFRAGHLEVIPFRHGYADNLIRQVMVNTEGNVVGATFLGLIGIRDSQLQTLTTRNGLPCNNIEAVLIDNRGDHWLYAQCGLISIAAEEIARWWKDPETKVKLNTFDALDGSQAAITFARPTASISPDGRMWFANGNVLQMFDSSASNSTEAPPPVHVEGVIANRITYQPTASLQLPSLIRDLEIDYTALSFSVPQRVKFRYKLQGHDTEWQDPGTRRQAFYTDLSPGPYTFSVVACNGDGVWNEAGSSLNFTVAPAYYQTVWFRVGAVALALFAMWLLYVSRLRRATAQIQERLGARLEERERIARELHDTLLQGFHGLMLRFQAIMKVLPAEGPAQEMMEDTLDRADEVLLAGRESVRDLREGESFDGELPQMLAATGEELAQNTSIAFVFAVIGEPQALNPVVFKEIYRIAREALSNAFQHSQAVKVELELTYTSTVCLMRVRDDGSGIDSITLDVGKKGHWGLAGMRERALKLGARLKIWSKAGVGTEIELTVPASVAYPRNQRDSIWQRIRHFARRTEDQRE